MPPVWPKAQPRPPVVLRARERSRSRSPSIPVIPLIQWEPRSPYSEDSDPNGDDSSSEDRIGRLGVTAGLAKDQLFQCTTCGTCHSGRYPWFRWKLWYMHDDDVQDHEVTHVYIRQFTCIRCYQAYTTGQTFAFPTFHPGPHPLWMRVESNQGEGPAPANGRAWVPNGPAWLPLDAERHDLRMAPALYSPRPVHLNPHDGPILRQYLSPRWLVRRNRQSVIQPDESANSSNNTQKE